MSVVTRCGAVGLLVGLLMNVAPAMAQATPGEAAGSSWIDPPVRGAAGAAPAERKPETKPLAGTPSPGDSSGSARKTEAAVTPAQRAASVLGVRPVGVSQRAVAGLQGRRYAVRPRMVERPLTLYRRPARLVERPSRRLVRYTVRRTDRSYAFVPDDGTLRVDPYDGRSYTTTWSSRRLAGWDGLVHEAPASRAARARESGDLISRMQAYERTNDVRSPRPSPLFNGFGDLD